MWVTWIIPPSSSFTATSRRFLVFSFYRGFLGASFVFPILTSSLFFQGFEGASFSFLSFPSFWFTGGHWINQYAVSKEKERHWLWLDAFFAKYSVTFLFPKTPLQTQTSWALQTYVNSTFSLSLLTSRSWVWWRRKLSGTTGTRLETHWSVSGIPLQSNSGN